ncbi:MAG: hypothetical protein ABR497_06575, partial [Kiritimatiellia bacterium]
MQKSTFGLLTLATGLLAHPADAKLAIVEDGEVRVPIVVFENAPPLTRQAADELARIGHELASRSETPDVSRLEAVLASVREQGDVAGVLQRTELE